MSAISNPQPTPVQVPPRTAAAPNSGTRWKVLLSLILLGAGGWAAWRVIAPPAPASPPATDTAGAPVAIRTAKVTVGPIDRSLRINGVTTAKEFAAIAAPMMRGPDAGRALILIQLAKSGSIVKKGELVAQIDAQSTQDHLDDVKAQVIQADADIRKRQAEQAMINEDLMQSIRNAKADLDKNKLDAAASEIRTPVDAEILKLAVEESQATYDQLSKDLANRAIANKAEVRILEITKERQVRHQGRHDSDLEKFAMRSPMEGLVVMESIFRSGEMGQIQLGDQVAPGQPFMKIVNTAKMQVDATTNQVDSEEMRIGQNVTLEFDAFPGLTLPGKVQSLGALGVSGWRQNFFIRSVQVRVTINGADRRVIPDLSASGDVVVEHLDNAVLVPLSAVQRKDGKPVVYVKQGEQFVAQPVELGIRNATHVAALAGVQAGQEVALDRPTAKPAPVQTASN